MNPPPDWFVDIVDVDEQSPFWKASADMIESLGGVNIFRVDGRLTENVFKLIELTPDIHLGLDSVFLGGFSAKGIEPQCVIGHAIESVLVSI